MVDPTKIFSLHSHLLNSLINNLHTKDVSLKAYEYNSTLVGVIIIAKILQTILFGPLRIEEIEKLMGQTWYTVVEFGVAFLIVREKLSAQLLCTASLYVLLKWFHLLAGTRVIEQTHDRDNSKKLKLWLVITLLHINDIVWLYHYYKELFIIANNGDVLKMSTTIFAVELSIMYSTLLATTSQLYLSGDSDSNHIYLSLVNIFSDVLKLFIYMSFSMVMLSHYCLPLHIFREAYHTLRLSIQKARALIWHKHLLEQYDISVFEPATRDDLDDKLLDCVICREVMRTGTNDSDLLPIKIKCGHIVHYGCLFQWLQRSCCCPTCRSDL